MTKAIQNTVAPGMLVALLIKPVTATQAPTMSAGIYLIIRNYSGEGAWEVSALAGVVPKGHPQYCLILPT